MRDFFIARQPIFAADRTLFAYELLFRDSLENIFPEICPNEATSRLIDGSFMGGFLDDFIANTRCFINFTFDSLVKKYPSLLPADNVYIEILETMRPGKKLLAECVELHQQGYKLALDDYIPHPDWINFYPYISIIKVDLQHTGAQQVDELIHSLRPYPNVMLLAERVETYEQFELYKAKGFSYFQGYFFAKPEMLQTKALTAPQLHVLQLMQLLLQPEPDLEKIVRELERDIKLAVRLLHYANSAKFKRVQPIDSIKKAVVLLGNKELHKFMTLLFVTQADDEKPLELARLSLVRGRFCELLSLQTAPHLSNAAFLTGILSLLDAIFDMPMHKITAKLPLSDDILHALNNGSGALSTYLNSVKNYEQGKWNELTAQACTALSVAQCYSQAMQWADEQLI